jgi:carbonic anhydrase
MKTYILVFLILSSIGPAMVPAGAEENAPLTAAQQAALTPEEVLQNLLAGNTRYVNGDSTPPAMTERIPLAANGQFPQAVILSCLDSRVPVEKVFDQCIGDIFVGRNAGNIDNTDQLGSMEFATKVAGAKLVMVLGHQSCGAVKGACDQVELGNITALLENIKPAVQSVQGFKPEERTSANPAFVQQVVEANVRQTLADIRANSPILADMEKNGEILIVGAVYSLEDGSVRILD